MGAEGKMEMEKVPALGYRIEGLPVCGCSAGLPCPTSSLPFKVAKSVRKARRIIKRVRGRRSGRIRRLCKRPCIVERPENGYPPTVIQEQNSLAGVTNKLLLARARRICVAYEGMDRFFPEDKITMTGNPLRSDFSPPAAPAGRRLHTSGWTRIDRPYLWSGAASAHEPERRGKAGLDGIGAAGVQLIWQTRTVLPERDRCFYGCKGSQGSGSAVSGGIWRGAFIERMDLAYAMADVVVSRAGACTVFGTEPCG